MYSPEPSAKLTKALMAALNDPSASRTPTKQGYSTQKQTNNNTPSRLAPLPLHASSSSPAYVNKKEFQLGEGKEDSGFYGAGLRRTASSMTFQPSHEHPKRRENKKTKRGQSKRGQGAEEQSAAVHQKSWGAQQLVSSSVKLKERRKTQEATIAPGGDTSEVNGDDGRDGEMEEDEATSVAALSSLSGGGGGVSTHSMMHHASRNAVQKMLSIHQQNRPARELGATGAQQRQVSILTTSTRKLASLPTTTTFMNPSGDASPLPFNTKMTKPKHLRPLIGGHVVDGHHHMSLTGDDAVVERQLEFLDEKHNLAQPPTERESFPIKKGKLRFKPPKTKITMAIDNAEEQADHDAEEAALWARVGHGAVPTSEAVAKLNAANLGGNQEGHSSSVAQGTASHDNTLSGQDEKEPNISATDGSVSVASSNGKKKPEMYATPLKPKSDQQHQQDAAAAAIRHVILEEYLAMNSTTQRKKKEELEGDADECVSSISCSSDSTETDVETTFSDATAMEEVRDVCRVPGVQKLLENLGYIIDTVQYTTAEEQKAKRTVAEGGLHDHDGLQSLLTHAQLREEEELVFGKHFHHHHHKQLTASTPSPTPTKSFGSSTLPASATTPGPGSPTSAIPVNKIQFFDDADQTDFLHSVKRAQRKRVLHQYRQGGGVNAGKLAAPFDFSGRHQQQQDDDFKLLGKRTLRKSAFACKDLMGDRRMVGLLRALRAEWGIYPREGRNGKSQKATSNGGAAAGDVEEVIDPRTGLSQFVSKKKKSMKDAHERYSYTEDGVKNQHSLEAHLIEAEQKEERRRLKRYKTAMAALGEYRKQQEGDGAYLPTFSSPAPTTSHEQERRGRRSSVGDGDDHRKRILSYSYTNSRNAEENEGSTSRKADKKKRSVTIEVDTPPTSIKHDEHFGGNEQGESRDNKDGSKQAEELQGSAVHSEEGEYQRPLFFREKFVAPPRKKRDVEFTTPTSANEEDETFAPGSGRQRSLSIGSSKDERMVAPEGAQEAAVLPPAGFESAVSDGVAKKNSKKPSLAEVMKSRSPGPKNLTTPGHRPRRNSSVVSPPTAALQRSPLDAEMDSSSPQTTKRARRGSVHDQEAEAAKHVRESLHLLETKHLDTDGAGESNSGRRRKSLEAKDPKAAKRPSAGGQSPIQGWSPEDKALDGGKQDSIAAKQAKKSSKSPPPKRVSIAATSPKQSASSPTKKAAPLSKAQRLEAMKKLQEQTASAVGADDKGATSPTGASSIPASPSGGGGTGALLQVTKQQGINKDAASPASAASKKSRAEAAAKLLSPVRKTTGKKPTVKINADEASDKAGLGSESSKPGSPKPGASPKGGKGSSPTAFSKRRQQQAETIAVDAFNNVADVPVEETIDDEQAQFRGLTAGDVIRHARLAKWCPPLAEVEDRLATARVNMSNWSPSFQTNAAKQTTVKLTAVIVAMPEYTDQKVESIPKSAIQDAKATGLFLGALGYRVTMVVGDTMDSIPTKDNIFNAVKHAIATTGPPPDEGKKLPPPGQAPQQEVDPAAAGVCFVYIAGRGCLGALHGYEGDIFYMLHQDTRLASMSRHNTIILNELTSIRNTTSNVQPIIMAEILPVNIGVRGVSKLNIGERFAVVQCGRRTYGSDMTIRYPKRSGGMAFTWYLLKGLQGDAIRSGRVTPGILNAYVKDSVEKAFEKMMKQQQAAYMSKKQAKSNDDEEVELTAEEKAAATAVDTEASKWINNKQSKTAEQELIAKDQQMFTFKKELQARKSMSSQTSCCFSVECLVDVSYLGNVALFKKTLFAKMQQTFYPKGKSYSKNKKLLLIRLFRTGDFRLQLDPELMGNSMSLVVSNGSCDEDVSRLVFGDGQSLQQSNEIRRDTHSSPAVQEDIARNLRRRVERLEYNLVTSASQIAINTETGRSNPPQEEVDDHIYRSYYKENVKKINNFSIHRGQERVFIVFEGTDRDFLETIKHGTIGTFCTKPLHNFTVLNVEYQQLAPTGDMVQAFNTRAAKELEQVQAELRQLVAEAENSPQVLRQWQKAEPSSGNTVAGALTKRLQPFLGTTTAPSNGASSTNLKPKKHDFSKPIDIPNGLPPGMVAKLNIQVKLSYHHDLCVKPKMGMVPPSRQSRRIFEAVIAVQSTARAIHTRLRMKPLLACVKECVDEKTRMFEEEGLGVMNKMKYEVEILERRRVLESHEANMRQEIEQLHGDVFADLLGRHVRYIPREENIIRKRRIGCAEEREYLEYIEEQFYRNLYFATASSYTRLLLGAVTLQHTESEKRSRVINIELSDRQKIKAFYQNSALQIIQAQQKKAKGGGW